MNRLLAVLTMVVPGAARACEHGRPMVGGMMRHCGGAGPIAGALMAGVSALGYWVLLASAKDSGWSRRAGQVVGWVLLVVGFGGFLCGAVGHMRAAAAGLSGCRSSSRGSEEMTQMPPGHPPIEGDHRPSRMPDGAKKAR